MELTVVWVGNGAACDDEEAKYANAATSPPVRTADRTLLITQWSGLILRALDKKCNVPAFANARLLMPTRRYLTVA
ncbi:hypothetical protein [Paraburkholderia xenovorans]|uniref:hypothetical protein n=1 Tax=Paraburkholderia xenovorans TaxID=36873 RepID=UPI001F34F389|nr:hypothetical protein [Paraburkholderia xenovorans]